MRGWLTCFVAMGCGRIAFDPLADSDAGAFEPIEITPPSFSTPSPTFVDVPGGSVTIPRSPGTRWLLTTSATLQSSGTIGFLGEARYLVDGIERGIGGSQSSAADRPGPWLHFYVIDGSSAAQSVVYQLRDASGGTAKIDQLRAVAFPLPSAAETHYASSDAEMFVSSTALTPAVTLPLGALAGDYVFLLLANASENPGTNDIALSWTGPNGEDYGPDLRNPRSPWQSFLMIERATVASSNASVTLNAGVLADTARFRYARALALRVDAFAPGDQQRNAQMTSTMMATGGVVNQYSATNGARCLVLAVAVVDEDCGNPADAERMISVTVDGTEALTRHVTDNCAYQTTYGLMRLSAMMPAAEIAVRSGNGEVVIHWESAITFLCLP